MLASQYYAGNRVVVFFEDTGWEPGTVISVKPPGIKISFDDGTEGIHNPEIDAVRIDEVCPDKLKECARRVELGRHVSVEFEDAGTYVGIVCAHRWTGEGEVLHSVLFFDDHTYEHDLRADELALAQPSDASLAHLPPSKALQLAVNASDPTDHCTVGDAIDACDSYGTWCTARVVDIEEPKLTRGARRRVLVHFLGWGSRFDEWIESGTGRARSLPPGATCAVGDELDACDSHGMWAAARVVEVRASKANLARKLKVHFIGF